MSHWSTVVFKLSAKKYYKLVNGEKNVRVVMPQNSMETWDTYSYAKTITKNTLWQTRERIQYVEELLSPL